MGEPKEDPEEAEDAEGPSDEELEAAMVEILKDAKDDFSIKDLLNKLREWSLFPRASPDELKHSCLLEEFLLHTSCHRQQVTLRTPSTIPMLACFRPSPASSQNGLCKELRNMQSHTLQTGT